MSSPSKTLKSIHRKQASGTPLRAFALSLEKDKQHRDTVVAWHLNKSVHGKKKKKPAPAKPKEAAAAPASAKGTVLKKR